MNHVCMVSKYIGSSYDVVKFVADNMDKINYVYESFNSMEDKIHDMENIHQSIKDIRDDVKSTELSIISEATKLREAFVDAKEYLDTTLNSVIELDEEITRKLICISNKVNQVLEATDSLNQLADRIENKLEDMIKIIEDFYPLDKSIGIAVNGIANIKPDGRFKTGFKIVSNYEKVVRLQESAPNYYHLVIPITLKAFRRNSRCPILQSIKP